MTEPLRVLVPVWRGDTVRETFQINNAAGTAAEDLTGWTVRIRAENAITGVEVLDQAPTPNDPATGQFQLVLTTTQTLALPLGQTITYQCQTTDPDGEVVTQFYGWFIVQGNMPA